MKLSDHFDEWRVFPRITYGAYLYFAFDCYEWVKSQGVDLTSAQAGFAGAVVAAAAAFFKFYVESGKRSKARDD